MAGVFIMDVLPEESAILLREHINKKSKSISIDKINLRNSENLKELEKINFVEEHYLYQ